MYGTTVVALLAGLASAKKCMNISIPITASARNGVFNIPAPTTNIDVNNFILDNTQQGKNYTAEILQGVRSPFDNFSCFHTLAENDISCEPNLQAF